MRGLLGKAAVVQPVLQGTLLLSGLLPLAGVVQGQERSGSDVMLEEVLVTAQKREETVQEVPLAVSVISSRELSERSVIRLEEALSLVPNLNVTSNVSANPRIAIRGVNTNTNNIGLEAGIGMQIDGVPFGRPSYMNTAVMDLERIEVLRGPQGTLYGKNTTGGLINIVSGRPQQAFGGAADLTLGKYDLRQFRGHITGPLNGSGTVSGRLATTVSLSDGWAEDRNPVNDDFQGQDFKGVRGHLLFEPGDDLSVLLTGFYSEDDAVENFQDIQGGPLAPLDGDPSDRSVENNEPNRATREISGVTASIDYRLDDHLTLTSVTGFLQNDAGFLNDQDYTALDILATSRREDQEQFSQELRLSSNGDGPFDWVAGVYYFDQSQDGLDRATLGEDTLTALGLPFVVPGYEEAVNTQSTIDVESVAAFASGSWSFDERWTVTAGLRITREKKKLSYAQDLEVFELAPGAPLGLVFAFASPVLPVTQSLSDSEPSGDVSLSYAYSDDVNVYARYSRGFKAGGFDSTQSSVTDPGSLRFEPEFVDSYEVGFKAALADRRVQLNVAAFYLDWSDKQEQDFNGAIFVTSNAASASNQGIEAELTMMATEQLRLTASLGVQDASYDTFLISDPGDPAGGDDRSGNVLPYSPDLSASLAFDYTTAIGAGWDLFLRGEAVYRDDSFTDSRNDARFAQASSTVVNARIGLISPGDRFSVHLWGKNVTDEDFFLGGFEFLGNSYASFNAPLTWGVELGMRW
jgi:iron complex outermembrane receptor protein